MAEADAVTEFKEGLALLRNNYAHKAIPYFTRALELDKANPFYTSYLGVAVAAAERKWDEAEELCTQALKRRRTQPELYLNLADVYRLAGRRQDQIETLFQGLQMTKRDPRIAETLKRYGVRRAPVLPFLERDNFLNRELGRLRYRVLKSVGR
jgi:tetratricopeptide (TPR) repeat protein